MKRFLLFVLFCLTFLFVNAQSKKTDSLLTVLLKSKEDWVKDNGNCITKSTKEKIFRPFFTTKPTDHRTRLRLNLSLSYDIIEAHGGEISIESIEGTKTVFTIILPFST